MINVTLVDNSVDGREYSIVTSGKPSEVHGHVRVDSPYSNGTLGNLNAEYITSCLSLAIRRADLKMTPTNNNTSAGFAGITIEDYAGNRGAEMFVLLNSASKVLVASLSLGLQLGERVVVK